MDLDLHWLAESGQASRLAEALRAGAPPDGRDEDGRTPLHVAVRRRRLDAARVLADGGADLAAAEDAMPRYQALHLACLPADGETAGDATLLELLLSRGAEPAARDGRGVTPLHLAVPWCDARLVRLFLERGAPADSPDDGGATPLHVACGRGAPALADVLLGDDARLAAPPPAVRADTALGRLEDEEVLEALLDGGARADAPDRQGQTPLHVAAMCGHREATRLLLERGAAPAAGDAWGVTPLHRADDAVVAALLLAAGAPLGEPDGEGRTPLHAAIAGGRDDVVDLLLARGADLAVADRDGRTALHLAAGAGRALTVEKLLEGGADVNAPDADGRTPLFWAQAAGHGHVVATLKRHGAKRREGRR
jgi:ankyrin repeat protein